MRDYLGTTLLEATCTGEATGEVSVDGTTWHAACCSHTFLAASRGFKSHRPLPRFVALDAEVRIALTRRGAEIMHAHDQEYGPDQGHLSTRLWKVMYVFGGEVHPADDQPFVGNVIEVLHG